MSSQAISKPLQAKNLQGCFSFSSSIESNDYQTQIASHGLSAEHAHQRQYCLNVSCYSLYFRQLAYTEEREFCKVTQKL